MNRVRDGLQTGVVEGGGESGDPTERMERM